MKNNTNERIEFFIFKSFILSNSIFHTSHKKFQCFLKKKNNFFFLTMEIPINLNWIESKIFIHFNNLSKSFQIFTSQKRKMFDSTKRKKIPINQMKRISSIEIKSMTTNPHSFFSRNAFFFFFFSLKEIECVWKKNKIPFKI